MLGTIGKIHHSHQNARRHVKKTFYVKRKVDEATTNYKCAEI